MAKPKTFLQVDKMLITEAFLKVVPICIPSLFGELVNSEVEKIKNILAKRLKVSKSKNSRFFIRPGRQACVRSNS